MALEAVKAFYEEVAKNGALQKKIAAADAAYNGDTEDKKAAVEAIVLPIAKEAGFDFTAEEMVEYTDFAIGEDTEISEDELEAVAGGVAVCLAIGFGNGNSMDKGAGMCKYIGLGFYIFD